MQKLLCREQVEVRETVEVMGRDICELVAPKEFWDFRAKTEVKGRRQAMDRTVGLGFRV